MSFLSAVSAGLSHGAWLYQGFVAAFQKIQCCKVSKIDISWMGGEVFHRGDPLWAFTSDVAACDGKPFRFQLGHYTESRRDYGVQDVDAVYFEKGVWIYANGRLIHRSEGEGAVKIPDPYTVETIYRDGYLALFYEIGALECVISEPHRVSYFDTMSRIWTLDRCILHF